MPKVTRDERRAVEPDVERPEITPNYSELLRITQKYSEATPKPGCPDWDGECMRRVTRRVADVDALLELADGMERRALDWDAECNGVPVVHAGRLLNYADDIRRACGEGIWPEPECEEVIHDRPFRERLTGGDR